MERPAVSDFVGEALAVSMIERCPSKTFAAFCRPMPRVLNCLGEATLLGNPSLTSSLMIGQSSGSREAYTSGHFWDMISNREAVNVRKASRLYESPFVIPSVQPLILKVELFGTFS